VAPGVFDHQAFGTTDANVRGRGQVHVGRGFGAWHLMPAEHAPVEIRQQPDLGQLHLHLEAVRARGAGDAPTHPEMGCRDGPVGAVDGGQLLAQGLVAAFVERGQPVVGQRPAGARRDQGALVTHRLADKGGHALGQRHRPAGFLEHVAQHAVDDGFAVDQHAVAVEQDGFKVHSG